MPISGGSDSRTLYYTKRWRRVRRLVLDRDGWRCRACGKAGRLEVDHVIPIASGGGEFWSLENLQALCRRCHFQKTGREVRERRMEAPEVRAWHDLVTALDNSR